MLIHQTSLLKLAFNNWVSIGVNKENKIYTVFMFYTNDKYIVIYLPKHSTSLPHLFQMVYTSSGGKFTEKTDNHSIDILYKSN